MGTDVSSEQLPGIGTRIAIGGSRATVRYVGQVKPTKGIWLGVEWDDAQRGKHDGTHDGVAYFSCRQGNAGSFIRFSDKVAYCVSFLQALRDKYAGDEEPSNAEKTHGRYSRKNLAEIEIEAPNMAGIRRRMAQLDRLKVVGLDGWRVEAKTAILGGEHVGEVARAFSSDEGSGSIASTCPNIEWLDLSRSLLPSWYEVALIARELAKLKTLILHFNRFEVLLNADGSLDGAFPTVVDLRLDGTMMEWSEVLTLAAKMPVLESLQFAANNVASLASAKGSPSMMNLRTLNLDRNMVSDWPALMQALQCCPHLERLILSNNPIPNVPSCTGNQHAYIRHISLAGIALASWCDVEHLFDWLPSLYSIVMSPETCPFLSSMEEGDFRPISIARLPRLRSLNHVEITERERGDAELFYISLVGRSTTSTEEREKDHPRYAELCQKHGKSIKSNDAMVTETNTLRSKLLALPVHVSRHAPRAAHPFVDPPSWQQDMGPTTVKLLVSTPLRLLQTKIARSLKLPNGVKSIRSIWALLGPQIDPTMSTAVQLRGQLRPGAEDDNKERIVFQLENLEWDLHAYNFSVGDELVIVIAE